MPPNEFTRKSQQLKYVLEDIDMELGRETKFVQRASKMTAAKFAQTLVLGFLDNPQATLSDLVQVSEELGVDITPQGLQNRINRKAVGFLHRLLERSLSLLRAGERLPGAVLEQFTAVNISDSSIITLPAAMQAEFAGFASQGSEAAVKFQLSFDYLSGNLNALEAEAGRRVDQSCRLPAEWAHAGSLNLFDLGYFNQDSLDQIGRQGAFFVVRYKFGAHLYAGPDDKHPIDLLDTLRPHSRYEAVYYLGRRKRVKVRLVCQRLPAAVVAERRRKAKAAARKKGHTPPKAYLALLAWSIYITNTTPEQLSFEQIVTIYRVRWQIELIFKVWKSQAKLAQTGAYRAERVLCGLYARLLGLVIFHWMIAPYRVRTDFELSMPKAFRILQRHAPRLLDHIGNGWQDMHLVLERIVMSFLRHAAKDKRVKNPSTYCLLVSGRA
jgi:hypothetical protein